MSYVARGWVNVVKRLLLHIRRYRHVGDSQA